MKYIERGHKIDENVAWEIINHRSLRHPNIIRFKEVVLTPSHLAIFMEYAAGGELFERICNAGRFSEDEARYFFQQVISGVNYCHFMPMPVEEAESLVKKWQDIKAEALGPNHHVDRLLDILDEAMLFQWQTLADTAKTNSCFWKFVLLQLSVLRADILTDDDGKVVAKIEAVVEEVAEIVHYSQPKNPNYYSTYTIRYCLKRQGDGSWRFCEGDIQASY